MWTTYNFNDQVIILAHDVKALHNDPAGAILFDQVASRESTLDHGWKFIRMIVDTKLNQ